MSKEMDKMSQFDYLLLVLAHLQYFVVLIYQYNQNDKQILVILFFCCVVQFS